MNERKETWSFTYRIRPFGTMYVRRRFRNAAEAAAFADGLRRGGAIDVRYEMERKLDHGKKRKAR
jgi:hypothetical protein